MIKTTRNFFAFAVSVLGFLACSTQPDPQKIIDQAIDAHGGKRYEDFKAAFDFRQYHIRLEHQNGRFRYQRSYADSAGRSVQETLSNEGLQRLVNGQPQTLDSVQHKRYYEAVNSVAYFVLLPYKLNDPAVIKKYAGESIVDGQPYHKIQVSFRKEGGGLDYEDVFFYWIHQKNNTLDYLAYSEGGPRFRKTIKASEVGGIRFQDYANYKGDKNDTTSVGSYDEKYQRGELELLSRIEQQNIRVE
ncbi:hypothetical protein GCM10023189_06080 [Nibrella saemangeumensis]|uniref:Deoxyribose-phosphate aldolase n=1 Tax=Nibrella saemangeumensis TaxID=1084526 RepID=A0ABP8MF07_9BACT